MMKEFHKRIESVNPRGARYRGRVYIAMVIQGEMLVGFLPTLRQDSGRISTLSETLVGCVPKPGHTLQFRLVNVCVYFGL